jgi:cation transport protein ChaC
MSPTRRGASGRLCDDRQVSDDADAADPFVHLPQLRGRVRAAGDSSLRVTTEVLAQWDARAAAAGQPPDWRLADEHRESMRRELLRAMPEGEDLWVFGYGSLMWDPGFHFAEVRLATVEGWRRRFAYRIRGGRGSPDQPALMLSLEPGEGTCDGLAFRVEAAAVEHESACIWRREMVRGGYRPTLLPVATPQGPLRALVFAANLEHPEHVGELPLDETVATIARAAGPLGTNRDYLEQLARQLDCLGLVDDYIRILMAEVSRTAAG